MQKTHDYTALVPGPRAFFSMALLASALALPRFAHTTPDSAYYIALAGYFKGELLQSELASPFAFRWVVPWLASRVPVLSSGQAIALCSLCATIAAYLIFARLLSRLVERRDQVNTGLLLLIVSFPTLNYGAAVLTDAAGFLVLTAASCAMLERRFVVLGVILVAGAGVRESTLLMLSVLWIFHALQRDRRGLASAGLITLATLAAAAAAREYFADLPPYFWTMSWERFTANLMRPVSQLTVLLTLLPAGLTALAGARRWRALPRPTRHFVVAAGVPCLALAAYSAAAAFMSGRFCWPLYLALVPLAALGVETWDRRGWVRALGAGVFGDGPAAGALQTPSRSCGDR